jgi:imidazolonepropionase-like amidohydrolase
MCGTFMCEKREISGPPAWLITGRAAQGTPSWRRSLLTQGLRANGDSGRESYDLLRNERMSMTMGTDSSTPPAMLS